MRDRQDSSTLFTMRAGRRFLVVPRFRTGSGRVPRRIRRPLWTARRHRQVLPSRSVRRPGWALRTDCNRCSLDRCCEASSTASLALEPAHRQLLGQAYSLDSPVQLDDVDMYGYQQQYKLCHDDTDMLYNNKWSWSENSNDGRIACLDLDMSNNRQTSHWEYHANIEDRTVPSACSVHRSKTSSAVQWAGQPPKFTLLVGDLYPI